MARGSQQRPFFARVISAMARFAHNRRGSVAVVFGLAFPVVALTSFFAVDFSRTSMAKQSMQEALDAATLIAARSTATTSDQIDAIGDAAFAAQIPSTSPLTGLTLDTHGRLSNVTFTLTGTTIDASAMATITPLLAGVYLSPPTETVHATSEVVRSINQLEIALVLDNTGSMAGSKISNLITAANDFVNQMQTATANSTIADPVKISVVPFSVSVKVNAPLTMTNYSTTNFTMTGLPTWLDGRARGLAWNNDIFTNASSGSARIDRFAMLKATGYSWGGCVEARPAPYDIRDDAPVSTNVNTLFIPYFWPDEPDTSSSYYNDYLNDVSTSNSWQTRQGYTPKYTSSNIKASGNISSLSGYTYGPNAGCNNAALQRLTENFTTLHTEINSLVASGDTDIPLGLMWGWHTLSPNAPFGDGQPYGTQHLTKIIVLMTDGQNTYAGVNGGNSDDSLYEGYGYIWQGRLGTTNINNAPAAIDARMVAPNGTDEALCSNIKAKDIQIYTIGVGVTTASQTLLTNCATTASNYYNVDASGTSLDSAFTAIAGSIQNLRISR